MTKCRRQEGKNRERKISHLAVGTALYEPAVMSLLTFPYFCNHSNLIKGLRMEWPELMV